MTPNARPLLSCLLAALLLALSGSVVAAPAPAPADDVPEDHTSDREGVLHAPGASDPQGNCAGCHGITDRADAGVACIDCHSASMLGS